MTPPTLFAALEATWPAAGTQALGPWLLRRGAGGGKRVSAATADGPVTAAQIAAAEAAMRAMGQAPLFMVRGDQPALDSALDAAGHAVVDPVLLLAGPAAAVAACCPDGPATFTVWPPLAAMREIWAAAGIGPARLAVMDRVAGPKTAILARQRDQIAGAAFVALCDDIAMLHALEVVPALRREGVGRNILGRAAEWAQDRGARWFALATTRENLPAQALCAGVGLHSVDKYHYRMKQRDNPEPMAGQD
jgi:GNAT superfamily N-acetyltransferase